MRASNSAMSFNEPVIAFQEKQTNKKTKLKLVATVQAVEMVDEKRISLSDATEAIREISWPRELRKEKEL